MVKKFWMCAATVVALAACASNLDAAATQKNLENVRALVAENEELHVKVGSPEATITTAKVANESRVRLAESLARSVSR